MYVSPTLTYIVWDRAGALKAVRINAHSRAITARSWLTHTNSCKKLKINAYMNMNIIYIYTYMNVCKNKIYK